MSDDDEMQPAPSREVVLAGIRRLAIGLDDYQLDVQIAITNARRNVAAAHEFPDVADLWHDQLVVLTDVRRERKTLTEAMEEAASPVTTRDLTDAEMAAWDAE